MWDDDGPIEYANLSRNMLTEIPNTGRQANTNHRNYEFIHTFQIEGSGRINNILVYETL